MTALLVGYVAEPLLGTGLANLLGLPESFGVGGPSVDTVLGSPHAAPGQVVTGQVRIQGQRGRRDRQVVLSLVTRVESHGEHVRL